MQTIIQAKPLPLAQKVYEDLLEDIAQNRRLSGERMIEAAIARDLDVSRTPVREALNRLENDGLIQSARPAGYVVIRPSIEDIREIFQIRRALEPVAFASVVARAQPGEDLTFLGLRDGIRDAGTPTASAIANRRFRHFWLSRTPNRRLRATLERYHLQVQLVRAATLHSEQGRRAATAGARVLARAFVDRDAEAAQAAMTDFVDAALAFFEQADAEGTLRPTPLRDCGGQ
ncbi:GntR family transcriptional regulator [Pseudooceanicola algae]|uniref:Uncharacterized protein n=1 Tax=Pseudooceanicola algae TaxID=1537215 RepID=A0A418SL02_9RHOB|nr:GntR family transcriptional regulator [Pseudooceanicola algae]QPM90911.1 hypothetical protein PSAL_021530 [Pseudooceanicola algae]